MEGLTFMPMVVEAVGGGWGPSANRLFSELAKNKACVSGELKNTTLAHLYQSLGIILHRENARSILRRSSTRANHMLPSLLTAAAELQSPSDQAHAV